MPQSRIDMTRVQEVAAAEDVTGHPYSLAITCAEGVSFIKGTCREETKWWADVLQVYSRNKVNLLLLFISYKTKTVVVDTIVDTQPIRKNNVYQYDIMKTHGVHIPTVKSHNFFS